MLRLQKILNHQCSKPLQLQARNVSQPQPCNQSEYVHFWDRSMSNSDRDEEELTETQCLHDQIQSNKCFLHEIETHRALLLRDIEEYHIDKQACYDSKDVMSIFRRWIEIAYRYSPSFIALPNAVCLSTVDSERYPCGRMVLLKTIEMSNAQFIFFTNYGSNKARSLLQVSDKASMCFYWHLLDLSVRIKGVVRKADSALSDKYWRTRPKASKLSAIVSEQSQPIASKTELERKYMAMEQTYQDTQSEHVPRPLEWGGFTLTAEEIEFWNGHKYRFHDRSIFKKQNDKWRVVRLQP